MKRKNNCPNCGLAPVANHPENGCVLAALMDVLRSRGISELRVRRLHRNTDAQAFWDDIGRVADKLEGGEYL